MGVGRVECTVVMVYIPISVGETMKCWVCGSHGLSLEDRKFDTLTSVQRIKDIQTFSQRSWYYNLYIIEYRIWNHCSYTYIIEHKTSIPVCLTFFFLSPSFSPGNSIDARCPRWWSEVPTTLRNSLLPYTESSKLFKSCESTGDYRSHIVTGFTVVLEPTETLHRHDRSPPVEILLDCTFPKDHTGTWTGNELTLVRPSS